MSYRGVVRHVRYWRGVIHSWSTVYQFVGTPSTALDAAACSLLLTADDNMCYGLNASDGGTYECALYNQASGGVPVANVVRFDHTTPGSWVKYGSASWAATAAPFLPYAEPALQVEWAAGLSHSGKPVILRKWYHALPDQGTPPTGPDIPAADVTKLTTAANALTHVLSSYGLQLGSSSGRLAGAALVKNMAGNHQMPRGRRRKVSGSKVASAQAAFQLLENEVYGTAGP